MNVKGFEKYLRYFIQLSFLVSFGLACYYRNYLLILVSAVGFILTLFPDRLEKKYKFSFSSLAEILILLFIYASFFLGEIWDFYYKFWWWDLMLHTLAGFLFGLLGLSLVYFINKRSRKIRLNPFFVALFGFCFSMTIGVFWEFFEFFMDSTFGFNMLKSGLMDTFSDLIVNSLGAFVVSVWGYYSLKHNFAKTVDKFYYFLFSK